ncbi:MAG: hypothetical protein GDA43_25400 [Hormoscilla sp. SP5CHS1]|nr:hypothetical protein [Hormoscilla sp. SP5CHS1]
MLAYETSQAFTGYSLYLNESHDPIEILRQLGDRDKFLVLLVDDYDAALRTRRINIQKLTGKHS